MLKIIQIILIIIISPLAIFCALLSASIIFEILKSLSKLIINTAESISNIVNKFIKGE